MQTYRVIGAPHYVSHWNENGYEISIKFDIGALVNSDQDLLTIYRNKFERAPYNPDAVNIDLLHNPPKPPSYGCCGGNSGGSINSDLSNVPEHYFFVDNVARDDYFESHSSELQKDVLVVSGGYLQIYDGVNWVHLALTVRGENATIHIGSVTTGEPGTDADVQNVGTATDAVLNFVIPRGAQGVPGSVGETITIEKEAAMSISGHRLVSCDVSGKIVLADWEHPGVIGLITQAVEAGSKVRVVVFGVVKHIGGWSFDLVRPILLNNQGEPVQSNVSNYPVITRVGRPVSVDSFLVTVELPKQQQLV
jgi:hypothetical protein